MFESHYIQCQGEITAHAVTEFGPGAAPTTIIRTDQPWRVNIAWKVRGLAVQVMSGDFKVSAYLESIGPGPDLKLPIVGGPNEKSIAFLAGALIAVPAPDLFERSYSVDVDVPAGTVPVDTNASQPYKLVTTITYDAPGTGTPAPMAGFVEGSVLQFYKPN